MSVPPALPAYYSQFGEDRLLDSIFGYKSAGVCVEVGAHNGVDYSNTYHFEQMGWDCVLVEPDPALCAQVRQRRKAKLYQCAAAKAGGQLTLYVADGVDVLSTVATNPDVHERIRREGGVIRPIEVAARTLDDILVDAGVQQIDFISIDVEGFELSVLDGFSLERWGPRVLVIEDNSALADPAIAQWLDKRGYKPFNFTGVNLWFARSTDAELVNWRSKARLATMRMTRKLGRILPEGLRKRLRPLKEKAGL